jgi:hypothetical protein
MTVDQPGVMRTTRLLPVLATALLALAGCANGADDPAPAGSTPAGGAAEDAPGTEDTGSPRTKAPGKNPASLELGTPSGTTPITPTEVYCSGTPGHLRHLIGKTDHQPPLVEVSPDGFAMVKLGHGRPYKSSAPAGITVGKDSITFADTRLGEATLKGTVTCTRWKD